MPLWLVPPLGVTRSELARTLYRAAKAEPGRRFHALYDKVHRRDVLERAWEQVRRNSGAPGIDQITLADVERYGVTRLLDELACGTEGAAYRPLACPPGVDTQAGRAGQAAVVDPSRSATALCRPPLKIVHRAGLRGRLPARQLRVPPEAAAARRPAGPLDESFGGRRWVVETDIANCFRAIPHDRLMSAVEERVCDRQSRSCCGRCCAPG